MIKKPKEIFKLKLKTQKNFKPKIFLTQNFFKPKIFHPWGFPQGYGQVV